MALEPLAGLTVVDLYAGSGALGIEALSRGALRVDFVERRGPALAALEANLEQLELHDRATVWRLDLRIGMKPLRAALESADLILLDPPYRQGLAESALAMLAQNALKDGVRVVVEHHAKDVAPRRAGRLVLARQRHYGETVVTTYACEVESSGGGR